VAESDDRDATGGEASVDWFSEAIVGAWSGSRTTPWQEGALPVFIEFTKEGTWSSVCQIDEACPVLYYGSAFDTSDNTYRLTSVSADGRASGRITLSWPEAEVTEGDLRDLHFGSDQSTFFFEFWATWAGEYGPIAFELER
jgi:hypothetical protein